jgi:methylase of polypeptide subunit release factors
MRQALGVDPTASRSAFDVEVYSRRLAEPSRLATLLRLFILGLPVPAAGAAEALHPLELGEAAELGLISVESGRVEREMAISNILGLWLAHDSTSTDRPAVRPDFVLGPGPASRTLAAMTVRRPVARALDIGTGSGIRALLMSRHADHVVATDTNERALRVTEMNTILNGVDHVEVRHGSLFEPVEGETFDLVASNPPFVVSPDRSIEYRDSGMEGDAISAAVVRGAAAHLEPGGFASVLCNWIVREGEEWSDQPTRWVEGLGCDAWLIHSESQDPLTYAGSWLSRIGGPGYAQALDRWLDYHRSLGVESVVTGDVLLRRCEDGDGWVRTDHVPGIYSDSASDHILRVFANQDYLERTRSDRELLDARFRMTADLRIDQRLAPNIDSPDGYVPEESTARLLHGLTFTGRLDQYVIQVMSGCDGTHRLSDLVRRTAGVMEVEVATLAPVVVTVVRQLLSLGFLETPR